MGRNRRARGDPVRVARGGTRGGGADRFAALAPLGADEREAGGKWDEIDAPEGTQGWTSGVPGVDFLGVADRFAALAPLEGLPDGRKVGRLHAAVRRAGERG